MGILMGLCVLLLVLNVAVTEDTVTPVYFTDGGNLTLEVRPPFPGHISSIVWKFNGNLLAEWVEDTVPLVYYPRNTGRANLTIETGQLIINQMKKEDEGVYSVEINNSIQSESYNATLIKEVQKPKVVLRTLTCTAESVSCNFSCKANTTGAKPITYSCKKGAGEWEVSGKNITTTSTDDAHVETLTCWIENPVSGEESDPEPNPLYEEVKPNVVGPAVRFFFAALVGVGVVGLLVAWIMKKGPFKNRGIKITASENGNERPTSPSDSATGPYENVPLQDNP